LDGEGYIGTGGKKSTIRIIITQSEQNNGEALVRWLAEQWHMGKVYRQTRRTNLGIDSTIWTWQIGARRDALYLLECLIPNLIIKKSTALHATERIHKHIDSEQRWTRWTEAEDNFMRENYGKLTCREIATYLSRSHWSVMVHARSLGIQRRGGKGWRGEMGRIRGDSG
jgi:hypothetical protein